MHIPVRILRALVDDLRPTPYQYSPRDLDRRAAILKTGASLMARHGRHGLTMANFAAAMRISPSTVRRLFPDLDNLLGEILRNHLMAISRALGEIPFDTPNRCARRRAAYLAATRGPFGALTEAHYLLVHQRHVLPMDELESVESLRASLGNIVAGDNGPVALALLDMVELEAYQMEAGLAAIEGARAPVQDSQPSVPEPVAARGLAIVPDAELDAQIGGASKFRPLSLVPLPDPSTAKRPRAGPH